MERFKAYYQKTGKNDIYYVTIGKSSLSMQGFYHFDNHRWDYGFNLGALKEKFEQIQFSEIPNKTELIKYIYEGYPEERLRSL